MNAPRRQKPDRRGRSARLRTLPPTPGPVKPTANPIDGKRSRGDVQRVSWAPEAVGRGLGQTRRAEPALRSVRNHLNGYLAES